MGPVLVLDVNVLRDERLVKACIARFDKDGGQIAIPEIALFELTKHPDHWESTVIRSLRLFGSRPDAVCLTRSSKPLGLAEEATGTPTTSVYAPSLTTAFRALLRDIDAGHGSDLQSFLGAVEGYRKQLDHERHAQDCLATMQALKKVGRAALPRGLVAAIGRDLARLDRVSFRDFLERELLIAQQRDAHVRRGLGVDIADALLGAPSISYLYALAVGAIGLEWTFRGGVETAAPRVVANDVLDIDYALAGLWVGRLVSDDERVRARFDDTKRIGSVAWPMYTGWFARAEAVSSDDVLASPLVP